MKADTFYVAPQLLEAVHRELGSDFCRALEPLTDTLHYEFELPSRRKSASPRQYAELREAKSLVSYLKYPDPTSPVRADELAWAMRQVRQLYAANAFLEGIALFDRAAKMLSLDLAQDHPLPADLGRKIANEIDLAAPRQTAPVLAVAVA